MYLVLSAGGRAIPFIVLCTIIALAIRIERQLVLNITIATESSSDD